jgi:cellulose synthase/poly-beta-1,6-N-acetylglucosamine synthase-like glycosyltransferase
MEILYLISGIIQIVLLVYLGLGTIYIFILAIAGQFRIRRPAIKDDKKRRFAVLIPGYKEDAVIVHVAEEALTQDYPQELYDVVIIADSFQPETLEQLRQLPIKVIEVSFEKSTKSKALNKAMAQLPEQYYDVALVLDADNVMEPALLTKLNESFSRGFRIIQGHRVAKNINNTLAILDAISEEINNHLFRKGHRVLGLSSALIGSGMAFEYDYFKDLMSGVKAIGGFDKDIELRITRSGIKIEYLEKALVYDEKVSETKTFSNQRRRWLAAQFVYFSQSFLPALKDLFLKGNLDFFLKSYQQVQPPRILLIGLSWILAIISFVLLRDQYTYAWLILWAMVNFSIMISIPRKFWNKQLLVAVAGLPRGFILMFLTLLKIRGANKTFIHTTHSVSDKNKK